ncbi:Protein of unknown function [Spirosomataceae bacterium TFI 002]|nr:Protein of unknown function [Spirosomataceae bacterium TFI 002]
MKYHLYIDESGDHGLTKVNPDFPVFLLCGVLIAKPDYENIRQEFNTIKRSLWNDKKVIFHSRDIRKCDKEFAVLFDLEKKKYFYEKLNLAMDNGKFTVIASAIKKDTYIEKFGRLSNDVYELALSFIIEATVLFLETQPSDNKELEIIIERRGRKEDKKLDEHFQRLLSRGTGIIEPESLKALKLEINFLSKKENINGLQLADLVAYPIARYVIEPQRANPAFDKIESKIYAKEGNKLGLKIYP